MIDVKYKYKIELDASYGQMFYNHPALRVVAKYRTNIFDTNTIYIYLIGKIDSDDQVLRFLNNNTPEDIDMMVRKEIQKRYSENKKQQEKSEDLHSKLNHYNNVSSKWKTLTLK